jgi:hypothetical protein
VREVVASVLVAGFFGWCGTRKFGGWPFFAAAAVMLGLGAFFIVDRFLQRRKERAFGSAPGDSIERALLQVNHQIWLLENVVWWYLTPGLVAYALVVVHCIAAMSSHGPVPYARTMTAVGSTVGVGIATFCIVYFLNCRAVKKYLIPRREGLTRIAGELAADEGKNSRNCRMT